MNIFSKPTLTQLRQQTLYQSEVALIEAHCNLQRAKATVDYLSADVARLKVELEKESNELPPV